MASAQKLVTEDWRDGPSAVSAQRLTKYYGSHAANSEVSIEVARGEVHAIVGENGAGKSTLAKMVAGALRPSDGFICVSGERVAFRSPRDALACGIGMVAQHPSLILDMSVVENCLYGHRASSSWVIPRTSTRTDLEALAERLGFEVPLDVPVEKLTLGQRQRAEILRLLRRKTNVLVLDEPTDVLSPSEGEMLFGAVRRFVGDGGTAILITHRLEEVMGFSDTVSVLRDGRVTGSAKVADTDERAVVAWMLGREYSPVRGSHSHAGDAAGVLRLEALTSSGRMPLRDVSFDVREGEIVGIAGVDGNGQEELAGAICGTTETLHGSVLLGSADLTRLSVKRRHELGLAYVPADRHREGLVLAMSVAENLALRALSKPPGVRGQVVQSAKLAQRAQKLVDTYEIKCRSVHDKAAALSGGNQQKIVLAREASGPCKAMVAAQPARGLDVAARDFVYTELRRLAAEGTAVLLISSDLDEVMKLSHRVLVLTRGAITGQFVGPHYDVAAIGAAMTAGTSVSTPPRQTVTGTRNPLAINP